MAGAWQGYWDALMAFLVILSSYTFSLKIRYREFISGLILGVAFMVKPQVQALLAGVLIFFLIKRVAGQRGGKIFLFLAGFIIPFAVFSIYFAAGGQSVFYLGRSLAEVRSVFPVLVGSEVNIWHTITRILQLALHQYGTVDSFRLEKNLFELITNLSLLLMFYLIARFALLKNINLDKIYTVSAIILPQIVVMSHVNHFYLASLLLIPYILKDQKIRFLWIVTILIHTYNMWSRYGLGLGIENPIPLNLEPALTILGLVQFMVTIVLLKKLHYSWS